MCATTCRGLPLLIFLLALSAPGCRGPRGDKAPAFPEIDARLAAQPPSGSGHTQVVWKDARRFYESRAGEPAWVDWKKEVVAPAADAALNLLLTADDHGLRAQDYQLESLRASRLELGKRDKDKKKDKKDERNQENWRRNLADFDVALTTNLLSLARDIALGTVDPSLVDARWNARRVAPDLAVHLGRAVSANTVAGFLESVRPSHSEYAGLQKAVAALRANATNAAWQPVSSGRLKPNQRHEEVIALRRRLAIEGYLPLLLEAPAAAVYDAEVEAAVRTFQEHHRLQPTGTIDERTLAELNIPLHDRLTQLAANLERWRWQPDDFGARHLRVNLPRFYLEAREDGRSVLEVRTVVGKQGDETPLLSSQMTHVVFSPYWNIPESIVRDETLPALARDPAYLTRQNIEVVRVAGEGAQAVDPRSIDWANDAALKQLAFRQRPGPANSLGLVKFMFPNDYSVYFHDTPADALFHRVGRTFSHGCVRLEDPLAVARYVLRDQPQWTDEAITAAMHAGAEKHVKLETPIPVHITYFTAWVDQRGGVHFGKDIYGYDAKQAQLPRRRAGKKATS